MGHDIRILTEAELRRHVALDLSTVEVVGSAFAALARGGVTMPPILSMALDDVAGELDVKTARLPGLAHFALKVSTGFYDNAKLGLPSLGGLMVLFSALNGRVEALLLDNGFLTDIRTAAAGAVTARALAPDRVQTAGVLGTGLQARLQLQAIHLVRPFETVLVWGRDAGKARLCAADLTEALGVETSVATRPEEVVRGAQLVVTTTPSRVPLVQKDWLHKGLLIIAMGSDTAEKTEIAPDALAAADLYVCDRVSQCAALGELRAARAAGLMIADPPELGQFVLAPLEDRTGCTICDLTGTGAQDTAIAAHVFATLGDVGQLVPT